MDYLLYSLRFGNIYWFAFFNFPFQFLQFVLKLGSLISMVVICLSPKPLSVLESEKHEHFFECRLRGIMCCG